MFLKYGIALAYAINRLGEKSYNIITNNCEHFVNSCTTGEHRSDQVRTVFQGIAGIAAVGILALTTYKILQPSKKRDSDKQKTLSD